MIVVHRSRHDGDSGPHLTQHMLEHEEPIPPDVVWIDLIEPTRDEDRKVEEYLGIAVPTREDIDYIEPSELLYTENGARFMTARLLVAVEEDPRIASVTFIIKDGKLVTVRYDEPRSFRMFAQRAGKPGGCGGSAEEVLAGLVDTIIDRAAEVLQQTAEHLDELSRRVFEQAPPGGRNANHQEILRALGRHGDLISKGRESLVSIERVLLFLSAAYRAARVPADLREQVRTTLRDLQSLEEHATFQSSKIQFLLDATLGLVNLEQNNIIKLFSVMAVVFMPPTLIASIYGMNFKHMPELDWTFGYPMALVMMVAAAIAPYFFFRWKRWL
jgi:magnesium transporter